MSYKIGKIKAERTMLAVQGEQVDSPIMITGGTLDLSIYDDITSIESWSNYGGNICTDELQVRQRIVEELNSKHWSGITSNDKDVVIKYYTKESAKDEATANTEKVIHLMGKGYTPTQAQGLLVQSYSKFHLLEIMACTKRANCEKIYEVIAKHLTISDASDLIKITHKLFDLFKSQAIRGTSDGSAGEGLFDFLESTPGTSYETTGLKQQGYVLNTGSYASFISELMDILRNGNY